MNLTDCSFPDHTTATGQEPTLSWMLTPKALRVLTSTPPPHWTLAPTSIQGSSRAHLYLKTKTHTGITAFKTKTRIVYSKLALCHSTRLCGQTLCCAENTFGLCVHWVAHRHHVSSDSGVEDPLKHPLPCPGLLVHGVRLWTPLAYLAKASTLVGIGNHVRSLVVTGQTKLPTRACGARPFHSSRISSIVGTLYKHTARPCI